MSPITPSCPRQCAIGPLRSLRGRKSETPLSEKDACPRSPTWTPLLPTTIAKSLVLITERPEKRNLDVGKRYFEVSQCCEPSGRWLPVRLNRRCLSTAKAVDAHRRTFPTFGKVAARENPETARRVVGSIGTFRQVPCCPRQSRNRPLRSLRGWKSETLVSEKRSSPLASASVHRTRRPESLFGGRRQTLNRW